MKAAALTGLVGAFLGLVLGLQLGKPKAIPVEKPAPAVRLQSGGLVLERTAPANPLSIPRDAPRGRIVRQQVVELEPIKPGPIKVEISEIQTPEGVRTVVTSEGAIVATGEDRAYPVPGNVRQAPRWAVQALWSPHKGWGAQVTRSWGPVVVSGAAWRDQVVIGVGVTF